MNEFHVGDVIMEIGKDDKYVVTCEDSYSYRVKCVVRANRDMVGKRVDKYDGNRNYVKVGTWDFDRGVEIEGVRGG